MSSTASLPSEFKGLGLQDIPRSCLSMVLGKSKGDWSNLPAELLDAILRQVFLLPDYIRFGAVCKSWRSIMVDQKPQRIASIHKQPPMLLIAKQHDYFHNAPNSISFKLYSIVEDKVYDPKIHVPCFPSCIDFSSSHGWLILFVGFYGWLKLVNPFTRKMMKIPCNKSCDFTKVILSCDPTTYPNDFVLAAVSGVACGSLSQILAFIKVGEKSWTFLANPKFPRDEIRDLIFHQGLFYVLLERNQLVAIDYKGDGLATIVEILPECTTLRQPDLFDGRFHKGSRKLSTGRYLANASNGDLLFFERIRRVSKKNRNKVSWIFDVYKLSEQASRWVDITELENNDSIFWAMHPDTGNCISVVSVPYHSNPNSIFVTHRLGQKRKQEDLLMLGSQESIGVFSMKDETFLSDLQTDFNGDVIVWITPTLQ
ncbi:OLC1v1037574C1 [Oldenlandia corymbosa var. corymbosa]|uniref:OLC1v1037574C1 n=1 Tax=Oldenlandia corymbosa var. corymbosa TaxID=529605 RepID=A0AAV1CYX0_OLDCO|nr:OLC1v1037574C1 [Oldenlandia corymbosa var. corymbosa]